MKVRLNIPALVLLAIPPLGLYYWVVPPLMNARSTGQNLAGLAIITATFLYWATLFIKFVARLVARHHLKKLLK